MRVGPPGRVKVLIASDPRLGGIHPHLHRRLGCQLGGAHYITIGQYDLVKAFVAS